MAQKHKRSCFKPSGSKCTTPETPSTSSKDSVTSTGSVAKDSRGEEPTQSNAMSSGGFRNFFRLLPFRGGFHKKTKVESSKKCKDQKKTKTDKPLEPDEVRQLIAMFSKYENLYNPKSSQYGNKQIESIYYADMARSFPSKTGTQLQAYINELRLSFEREHAIIESARRSSGQILEPSIEYYVEFLFLVPFLTLSRNGSHALTPSVSVVSIGTTDYSLNIPKEALSHSIADNLKCLKYAVDAQGPSNGRSLKGGQQALDEPKPVEDQSQEAQQPEIISENQTSESPPNPQQELNTENRNSQADPSCDCPQPAINSAPVIKSCRCKRPTNQGNVNSNCQYPQTGAQVGKNNANPYPANAAPVANYACTRPGQCQGPCSKQEPNNSLAMNQESPTNVQRAPEQRGGSPNRYAGNGQQVQLLCDMIRAELSSAPDFIYYDAKWRIIEILREVNKRQMIHKKGDPAKCGCRPSGSGPSPANAQKCPVVRDCHLKAKACPYCSTGYRG